MSSPLRPRLPAAMALCALLAACGTADPVAYSGIASSAQLAPNPGDRTGRIPFRYSTPVNWRSYSRVIIEPVAIYRGADHQFGEMTEGEKMELARYVQTRFAQALGQRFGLTTDPRPGTLRIRLTLTGAATNTPLLSTLTRFDLSGGIYNGVQAIRGGEGIFTGSVSYAVEIHDAAADRLLEAFVTKQYPNAYNIPASMGALAAARTGIEKGAEELAAQLR